MEMQYWKIAPGEEGFLWAEQRDAGCIAVGWNYTGDLRQYHGNDEAITRSFQHARARRKEKKTHELLTFYKKVKRHDKILASVPGWIYGVGTVKGGYRFCPKLSYKHARSIRWELKFWAPIDVDELRLPRRIKKRLTPRRGRTISKLSADEWSTIDRALSKIRSPFEGMMSFEGLPCGPRTEQELIILFSKLNQHLKMKIESVGTHFPDALIKVKKGKTWITVPAEFELNSSRFEAHGHLDQIDWDGDCFVTCWRDDWKGHQPARIKIVELRKELQEIL